MADTRLLEVTEYAPTVGLHPNTVQKMLRAGRIPGAVKAGKGWRIPEGVLPLAKGETVAEPVTEATPEAVTVDQAKAVEQPPETFNELAARVNSGEATLAEMASFASVIDKLRGGKRGEVALVSIFGGMYVPLARLEEREESIRGDADMVRARMAAVSQDEKRLAQERSALEDARAKLDHDAGQVALVAEWAANTAQLLTSSPTWEKAYYAEGSKLPEWPETVEVDKALSWGKAKKKR